MVEPSHGIEDEIKQEPRCGRASITSAPHSDDGTGHVSAGRPKDSTASIYGTQVSWSISETRKTGIS